MPRKKPTGGPPTVAQYFAWWWRARYVDRKFGNMRDSKASKRVDNVEFHGKEHIIPACGNALMSNVDAEHVAMIVNHMKTIITHRGGPPSANYVKMAVTVFKAMVADAACFWFDWPDGTRWRLDHMPSFKGVRLEQPPKTVPTEHFLPEEVPAMLTALRGVRDGGAVALMLVLGLRSQEARDLRRRDIVLDAEAYAPAAGVLRYKPGDRKEGIEAEIPLPHELVRFLPDLAKLEADDRLFPFCRNDHVAAAILKAAALAGIDKRVTPIGLRHTTAQALDAAGVPITDIAKQLNHQQVTTTMRYVDGGHTMKRKAEVVAEHARRMFMGV